MDVEATDAPATRLSADEGDSSRDAAHPYETPGRQPPKSTNAPAASPSIERATGGLQPLLTSRSNGAARDAELLLLRLDRVGQVLQRVDRQLIEARRASDDLQASRPRQPAPASDADQDLPATTPAGEPPLSTQPSRLMHYTARLHNYVAWQLLRLRVAIDSLVWQLKANH